MYHPYIYINSFEYINCVLGLNGISIYTLKRHLAFFFFLPQF
ncbi:unnamed protein product, partial [Arabidopsis halleri]